MRITLVLIGLVACAASANTLDQFSPFTNTSFNMLTPSLHWQQEVVVGLPGPLVEVDLYVVAPGSCNFYITAGPPWQGGTPNWSTTFSAATTGWVAVDTTAAGLSFTPGQHFVLGFDGGGNSLNLGGSYAPPNGGYPAGLLFLNAANYADGGFDIGFKTYVPEPAGLALFAAVLLLARRSSR